MKREQRQNYERQMRNDGIEVEIVSLYLGDGISNPPDYSEVVDKILEILKDTGIAKITITNYQTTPPPNQ